MWSFWFGKREQDRAGVLCAWGSFQGLLPPSLCCPSPQAPIPTSGKGLLGSWPVVHSPLGYHCASSCLVAQQCFGRTLLAPGCSSFRVTWPCPRCCPPWESRPAPGIPRCLLMRILSLLARGADSSTSVPSFSLFTLARDSWAGAGPTLRRGHHGAWR